MALLLTSVIGNAIGLPYLQDDRTRNRNQQSDISRQKKTGLSESTKYTKFKEWSCCKERDCCEEWNHRTANSF